MHKQTTLQIITNSLDFTHPHAPLVSQIHKLISFDWDLTNNCHALIFYFLFLHKKTP